MTFKKNSYRKKGQENPLIYCSCGCDEYLRKYNQWGWERKFIHGHQRKLNSPFKKGKPSPNKNKKMPQLSGKNNGMFGKERTDLSELNRSRVGIPIPKKQKEKQRNSIKKYYNSEEGKKTRKKISKAAKEYSKNNLDKVRERGIKGHMSCPKISKQEKIVRKFLEDSNIKFIQQYKYKLGVADFLIIPNKILFVDGDYWHGNPEIFSELTKKQIRQNEKDKIQTEYLECKGYNVMRIWENEIRKMSLGDFKNKLEEVQI